MELDGGICVVRSWQWGDEKSLVKHANNRNVWLRLRDRFPHPYTHDDAINWLQVVHSSLPETNFAITVEGKAVGGIGFTLGTDIERHSAEIGYWLGEMHWGKGITTRALQLVTHHAFEIHPLLRIFALPFGDNLASQRVLEKVGYVREGVLRHSAVKDGRILDHVMYALLREEWEKLHQMGSSPAQHA